MDDSFFRSALSIQINPSLPRLAWIAEVDRRNLRVKAVVGSSVEYGLDFLVSGIWDGRFRDGDFENTACFFGSGLVVRGCAVTLVPSAAISETIYYYITEASIAASNSLPLLLAGIDDRLDPKFEFYGRITESIRFGIDAYEKIVPTERGQIARIFYRNLRIAEGTIEEVDKPRPPHFPDFSSYLFYLMDEYSKIYKNIRDADRRHALNIISTQSRGYDTTAVNTIAAKHGIDRSFTVTEAKKVGAFVGTVPRTTDNDDGSDICRILGIKTTPLDRHAYKASFVDEYLFYSAGCHADAASLLGIKPWLRQPSVMLTGMLGDLLWSTDIFYRQHQELLRSRDKTKNGHGTVDPDEIVPEWLGDDFCGPDTWLQGMSEVNLEWGLIPFSPIFIGGRNRADIYRITMSQEMTPWRLDNNYDRPIARRIGEEIGGIPREAFGQKKMAAVTEFPPPLVPIDSTLREEYFAFLSLHGIAPVFWRRGYPAIHWMNARIIYHTPHHYRYLYYSERLISKMIRKNVRIPVLYRHLNGALYCFCVNKRTQLYKETLSKPEAHRSVSATTASR